MRHKQRVFGILTSAIKLALGSVFVFVILGGIGVYDVLHPPRIVPPGYALVEENVNFQRVNLFTQDGIRLAAWYTPPENRTIILLAHGYGDNRPEWVYAMLAKKGYGVLAWGGATMIRAAAEFPEIEALVVASSFSSLNEEIDFLAPYPLINPLTKFLLQLRLGVNFKDTSPATLIGKISPRPVYIIQGSNDTVASPDSAEKLYNVAGEPRYLWIYGWKRTRFIWEYI